MKQFIWFVLLKTQNICPSNRTLLFLIRRLGSQAGVVNINHAVHLHLNLTSRVFSGHSGFLPPQIDSQSNPCGCGAVLQGHMDHIAAARGAFVCFPFDLVWAASLLYFATAISSDSYYYYYYFDLVLCVKNFGFQRNEKFGFAKNGG